MLLCVSVHLPVTKYPLRSALLSLSLSLSRYHYKIMKPAALHLASSHLFHTHTLGFFTPTCFQFHPFSALLQVTGLHATFRNVVNLHVLRRARVNQRVRILCNASRNTNCNLPKHVTYAPHSTGRVRVQVWACT